MVAVLVSQTLLASLHMGMRSTTRSICSLVVAKLKRCCHDVERTCLTFSVFVRMQDSKKPNTSWNRTLRSMYPGADTDGLCGGIVTEPSAAAAFDDEGEAGDVFEGAEKRESASSPKSAKRSSESPRVGFFLNTKVE